MGIKDILVQVDHTERAMVRIDLATALAREHESHLTGLAINRVPYVPGYIEGSTPASVLTTLAERTREANETAEKNFRDRCDRAGISAEWREIEPYGDAARLVGQHARYVDLVIVGQGDPDADNPLHSVDFVDKLVLNTGVPVVVVPRFGTFKKLGERILLAWNGSREGARALKDALPLMNGQTNVTVMQVNPPGNTHAERDMESVDIAAHLARHGIKVEAAQIVAEDMKVGDMLLSRAADYGADLIVMGAYGHSRLSELVLGGVTRYILRHMTMPVLMSH